MAVEDPLRGSWERNASLEGGEWGTGTGGRGQDTAAHYAAFQAHGRTANLPFCDGHAQSKVAPSYAIDQSECRLMFGDPR